MVVAGVDQGSKAARKIGDEVEKYKARK